MDYLFAQSQAKYEQKKKKKKKKKKQQHMESF